jgi:exopolyphosphatase/guanosine-5'-triphosphate,3'-diphosphate pyrophosphatase
VTRAVVDIGSNSCRLFVVDHDGRELVRRTDTTRLAQGLTDGGALQPDALERTIAQLRGYREVLDTHDVARLRVVTTAVARRADEASRTTFLDAVEAVLGVRPDVLTGPEEGRLAYLGATSGLPTPSSRTLVVDIGGGSTELIAGTGDEVVAVASLPLGCVSLTERELHHDPPRPDELTNAIGAVQDEIEQAVIVQPALVPFDRVIGVAGTLVTVAMVEMGLPQFRRDSVHGFTLTRAAAEDVFRTLATESFDDRVHNPGLARSRADVIVGGCCIVVGLMRTLRLDEITISVSDLLDGALASVPLR